MATVLPFTPLLPLPSLAPQVAAVPYDVVSRAEAHRLGERNSESFLHISRSEIDLPVDISPYDPAVYAKSASNLCEFIARGTLKRSESPALYVYRLIREGHEQIGIVGLTSVADYDTGKIVVHEKTRPEKEDDRVNHILATLAHAEPTFLTYRESLAPKEISEIVLQTTNTTPLFSFTAEDGVSHTLWVATESERLAKLFSSVSKLYIADGHHRSKAASRVCNQLGKNLPGARFFLSVIFPDSELKILPYNRVIKRSTLSRAEILELLARSFSITECGKSSQAVERGHFALYLAGSWFYLTPLVPPENNELDVSFLFRTVLSPVFGIQDERIDDNIEFIGGIRGTTELMRLVDSGSHIVAFSLHPVSMAELLSVADNNGVMPPKSTWFEPKLRSGLFVYTFGDIK